MARRLLDGDSRIWVKIDNENSVIDPLDIYKPTKSTSYKEETLFDDYTEDSDEKSNITNKSKPDIISSVALLLTVIIIISLIAYKLFY